MNYLYELDSRLDAAGSSGTLHASCESEGAAFCVWCGRIRQEYMPRPLWAIMRDIHPGATYASGDEPAMKIFHTKLLRYLPALDRHIRGPVTMDDGHKTEYVTLYALQPLIIQGGNDTGACPECGEIYRDQSAKRPYVQSSDLGSKHLFQEMMSTLIITERLKGSIPWDEFPDIELRPIEIR